MDLHATLTAITFGGLVVSFVGGVMSQLFKSSVEVQGQITKRLTPAGWLSLGISLVGLSGSVASELIRVSIKNDEEVQKRAAQAQEQALRAQELTWRRETSRLLGLTKTGIEKNIIDTIAGFQASNLRFNQAQAQLLTSKQSLLEDSLHRTNQVIVSGQPLTSLTVRWHFASPSRTLLRAMAENEAADRANAEDVQGGVPRTPFEAMRAQTAMTLLAFVARAGVPPRDGDSQASNGPLMLLPLDDAHNAVLSFGDFPESASANDGAGTVRPSALSMAPGGLSVKRRPGKGAQRYELTWELDSVSLPKYVDRRNGQVPSTSRMPPSLQLVLLSDFEVSPVRRGNLAEPYADDLWSIYNETPADLQRYISGMGLELEVNGFSDMPYRYRLNRAFRRELSRDADSLQGNCLVLEFALI